MTLPTISFRAIQDADLPFLEKLYASTRQDEMAATGWSEQQIAEFLAMQFQAQHQHYMQHYPTAQFNIILAENQPIGRFYWDHWKEEFRLIDIALLPGYRNQGLGTRLLLGLLEEATASNKPVRIHVEYFNPALRWYQRLGFRELANKGVYSFMEWRTSARQVKTAS